MFDGAGRWFAVLALPQSDQPVLHRLGLSQRRHVRVGTADDRHQCEMEEVRCCRGRINEHRAALRLVGEPRQEVFAEPLEERLAWMQEDRVRLRLLEREADGHELRRKPMRRRQMRGNRLHENMRFPTA
ncbi:MAG: hypothetical protein NTW87_07040 [Planctomycetota bacterium]|nr:hypothetical protein [Planctomycetota bacterium]